MGQPGDAPRQSEQPRASRRWRRGLGIALLLLSTLLAILFTGLRMANRRGTITLWSRGSLLDSSMSVSCRDGWLILKESRNELRIALARRVQPSSTKNLQWRPPPTPPPPWRQIVQYSAEEWVDPNTGRPLGGHHTLKLGLSVLSLGCWLPPLTWLILWAYRRRKRTNPGFEVLPP